MKTYEVSLDMESVLADLHPVFLERYNDKHETSYVRNDIQTWDWVQNEISFDEFMTLVDDMWVKHNTDIPVSEPRLDETVEILHSHPQYTVDIVTARTGVEDEMRAWLEDHGITTFREFISTSKSKAKFGYDYYIDDNPNLADDLYDGQLQYLITGHNPWTDAALLHNRTIPVRTVNQAVTHLVNVVDE